jgi:DNA (cytosine-5)-methyltransferase 1
MIGVDLFAGAGGMSLGARQAGVDVRLAVECDPHAAATYHANHPDTHLYVGDIRKLSCVAVRKNGSPTVLLGGPPCQGFSTSNQRTRNKENTSNWLFREFTRLVSSWKPDWVVFENVKGILETEGGQFVEGVETGLKAAGYTTSRWLLNAADYGVPQRRFRFFLVASHHGIELKEPEACLRKPVTVKQAFGGLPILNNGAADNVLPYRTKAISTYANLMRGSLDRCANHLVTRNARHILARYPHVPQGGNWEDIPSRLMKNYADRSRCHTGIYHRLHWDEPSVVVGNFRKNMLIHPRENRGLSVREAARLQSFPDWYEFRGSIGFQQQQVGNAVPPLLAEAVFAAIMKSG